MLFAKSTPEGVRLSGFVDEPSLVIVTVKTSDGARIQVPFDCDESGPISRFVEVKSAAITDVVGIPVPRAVKSLYISRRVKNAQEIIDWFKSQGMKNLVRPEDMHVTVAFSKKRVDWEAIEGQKELDDEHEMEPSLRRSVTALGDASAVLKVESKALHDRWQQVIVKGGSWDYPSYNPHITLSYSDPGVDLGRVQPFPGIIRLGRERFAEIPVEKKLRQGDHASPPKGYPDSKDEYAVPEDYAFPINNEERTRAAISYFHKHSFDSPAQKRSAARRILRAAKKFGIDVSKDSDVARAAHGE